MKGSCCYSVQGARWSTNFSLLFSLCLLCRLLKVLSDRQNKVQMRKNTNMVPGNYCMCQPKVKFVDLYNKKEFVDLYNAFDTTKSFFKCCQNTETLPILCVQCFCFWLKRSQNILFWWLLWSSCPYHAHFHFKKYL